jgi:excisionase family DNA binding protein
MVIMSENKKLYTATELAKMLNVHINTVRRWSNKGVIKAYRIGPRGDRRFEREDIMRFLEQKPEIIG